MNASNALVVVCQSLADSAMQEKLRSVLPSEIPLDRFTRVTLTAIQKSPEVADANRQSLYNACVEAAARGLMPDKREGALVIRNTKQRDGSYEKIVQFQPMPEGVIKELARIGVKAHSASVYEKDHIEVWNDDDGQHIKHVPKLFGDRGERIGAVAWGTDREGHTYVETVSQDEIERIKAKSSSKDRNGNVIGPWVEWPERMEQKSALHRLRKRVPIVGPVDEKALERLRKDEVDDIDGLPAELPQSDPGDQQAEPVPVAAAPKQRPKGLQAVVDQGADAEHAADGDVF